VRIEEIRANKEISLAQYEAEVNKLNVGGKEISSYRWSAVKWLASAGTISYLVYEVSAFMF